MNSKNKKTLIIVSVLLVLILTVGVTIAYMYDKTTTIQNIFQPSKVTTEVEENFVGVTKSNVTAKNTGDIDAYIRIKLISYRVNAEGQQIGGTAAIPKFEPGEGWILGSDGHYYYTSKVEPKASAPLLIGTSGIQLEDEYTDADGGKQVIEVMAEAVQADGGKLDTDSPAVIEAWGTSNGGSVKNVTNGMLEIETK